MLFGLLAEKDLVVVAWAWKMPTRGPGMAIVGNRERLMVSERRRVAEGVIWRVARSASFDTAMRDIIDVGRGL